MTKKRKAKNLTLPLLGISLFTTLGITIYLNRPRPTALRIAEVSAPASNCAQVAFTDTFTNSTLDSTKWTAEINLAGKQMNIVNGTVTTTSPKDNQVMRILGTTQIGGDFIAEVDLLPPSASPSSEPSQFNQLAFRDPQSQGNYVSIARNSEGKVVAFFAGPDYDSINFNSRNKAAIIPKDSTIRARIVRNNSTFHLFYKITNNYIELGNFPNITNGLVTTRLNLGSINGSAMTQTSASFDNFSLGCLPENKPVAPLNLRATCNPDGKSVRLIWDGVVDSESYKVRLDDKNGKVTNFDNLKEPQYIASITPDKTYSFWVHAHKGDSDSNQSTVIDFTCKVTSTPTPTPKPTIKSTPKPTTTPTLAPSPTPKASVYTPVEQTGDLDIPGGTTAVADIAPDSTNPVSRFFRWLASLFE